jgi:pantoate--beta-alanine ligase
LNDEQRQKAPHIYEVLSGVEQRLQQGRRDYAAMELAAADQLKQFGFVPDYVSIRDAGSLQLPSEQSRKLVVLTAARLGRARLIDNVQVVLS